MHLRQHIFFDLGWTLEDETQAQMDRAGKAARAAMALGLRATAEGILRLQEIGAQRQVPSVFEFALGELGLDDEQVRHVSREAGWDKSHLRLYPEAKPVLEHLGQRHFLGIIANQSPGTEDRLRRYGIRDCFELIYASAEGGLEKPDPRVFEQVQRQTRCEPQATWMIGDRLDNDIRPAKQAGWKTIRILNGYNARQQPRDDAERPDYTVKNLKEIVEIVTGAGKRKIDAAME